MIKYIKFYLLSISIINDLGFPTRINSDTNTPEWKDVGADTWYPFKSGSGIENASTISLPYTAENDCLIVATVFSVYSDQYYTSGHYARDGATNTDKITTTGTILGNVTNNTSVYTRAGNGSGTAYGYSRTYIIKLKKGQNVSFSNASYTGYIAFICN